MPKVSIIVPVYNVEKYLRQCLDSIVNQTLTDIEIICVNDGSPDNSLAIIEEYASKDKRIKIINQENQGLGASRNNALKIAIGKYVMYLDSDDFFENSNSIEIAYNQIEKNNNDVVIFNYYKYFNQNLKKLQNVYKAVSSNKVKDINNFKIQFLPNSFYIRVTAWNKIYNREFLIKNKMFFLEGYKFEDFIFMAQLIQYSQSASIINYPLICYRSNPESIVNTSNPENIIDTRIISLNKIKDINIDSNIINECVLYSIMDIYNWLKKYKHAKSPFEKDFYSQAHRYFNFLYDNFDINLFRESIDFRDFELIRKCESYKKYKIVHFINNNIFSVLNIFDRKIITILGIKFKIKKVN